MSLQILRVPIWSVDKALRDGSPVTASGFYEHVLSTIQSPAFYQVQILYQGCHFRAVVPGRQHHVSSLRQLSRDEEEEEALQHLRRFELFREMYKVRDFRLVLCATTWESREECVLQLLKEVVAAEKARGGFNDLFPEPLVISKILCSP